MNRIKETIKSFSDRGGLHIFISTIFLRIVQFVLGILIIRLLTKEDYGNLSFAFSITQLIVPFSGAGLYLSLLHFGPIQKTDEDRIRLFAHTLQRGFVASLVLMALIVLFAGLFSARLPGSLVYLRLFSFYVIAYYFFYSLVSLLRIKKRNKAYAGALLGNSLLVFGLSLLGVFLGGGRGYTLGFVTAPAITALLLLLLLKRRDKERYGLFTPVRDLPVKKWDYTKYGLYAGLGNIASQMAWQLDTIMIGILIAQSTEVAVYRAASLIPFSLIFIPSVFMQTDFVYIAERFEQKKYLIAYYKKYLMIFGVITALVLGIWYAGADLIVGVFGPEYTEAKPLIHVLMINVFTTFLFRVPLGNMLAAVGKASWNSYSAFAMLIVNLLLNLWLIPLFGVFGAAYATVTSIGLSSLLNLALFAIYLKQLDNKKAGQ
ncbi:MAG: oligosaccharide flippase family protein [Candidatus Neomarinimicrobiota bacterium]|jgi:O-antigen/teichoic acid export membrane protein|nr:oligosaccharide flippase family protein [Candidatus Neomarinimicrobiota bacterium]